MLLTEAERKRFIAYLEQDAQSNKALYEQMSKMPGMDAVAKMYKHKIAAALIIAADLANVQMQTLEAP